MKYGEHYACQFSILKEKEEKEFNNYLQKSCSKLSGKIWEDEKYELIDITRQDFDTPIKTYVVSCIIMSPNEYKALIERVERAERTVDTMIRENIITLENKNEV